MKKIEIHAQLNPNLILNILASIIAFLILMGCLVALILTFTPYKTAMGIVQLFDMDAEGSVTSYFSALDLGFAASLLSFITYNKKKSANKYWRHWLGLSLGFVLLSIDENVSIHELIIVLFREHHVGNMLPPHYMTTMIGGTAVACLFLVYAKFLQQLPAATRTRFLFSGATFILGAFAVEFAGGYFISHSETWPLGYYHLEVVVEESLEMIGILLFIRALFLYIGSLPPIIWIDAGLSLTSIEKDKIDEMEKIVQLSETA